MPNPVLLPPPRRNPTATLPPGTFAPWLRAALFLLIVAAPAGIIVHLIANYAIDVPFWDQWETARLFAVTRFYHPSLLDLARQQNESRLLFPNLIFLALSWPTGTWSVVREMYVSVALVVVASAALFSLLRRAGFALPMQAGLLFLIDWLLFSPTQQENWFFGIQICYYLPPAALCCALVVNSSRLSLAAKTVVSLALAFVAAYSFSGGVIVCVLAFPGLLPGNWSQPGRWLPGMRRAGWHLAYLAASGAMLAAYFWNYQEPAGAGSLLYIFEHLGESLSYFFAWLGSPLLPRGPLPQSIAAGVVVALVLAGLLGALWRAIFDRRAQERLYPWVVLAAYGVGTGLLTVIGRSGFGTEQALSSRYIVFSSYAYVAVLVLGAYLWCIHWREAAAWMRGGVFTFGLFFLAGAGWLFTVAQLDTMPWIVDASHFRNFAAQGLTFMPLMRTSQNLDTLCGVSDLIQVRAFDLLRRHVLAVPLVTKALAEPIQHVTELGNADYGVLDQPDMDETSRVSIRGWAVDPILKQPAGDVLVTCTDRQGVTHPLVVLTTDVYRPDEAPAAGSYQQLPCAFNHPVDFSRLAPGEYLVAAWAVDVKQNSAHQLGATYPFRWERPGKLTHPVSTLAFPPLNSIDNGPRGNGRHGYLDAVTLKPDRTLSGTGWAININTATPPKAVLLTCTDRAGKTMVVGQVGPGEPRKEIAGLFHNDALLYCGYTVHADVSALPAGDYTVAAWDVGFDAEETVAQLALTYPIVIPPK